MKTAGLDLPYVGTQLLYKAVKEGNVKVVELFLRAGVDVNSRVWNVAVETENAEIVKLFLRAGADANRGDYWEARTPLHLTVEKESAEIVKLLLQAGADVDKLDWYRWTPTPLDAAMGRGNTKIIRLLQEAQEAAEAQPRRRYYYLHGSAKGRR